MSYLESNFHFLKLPKEKGQAEMSQMDGCVVIY